MVKPRVFVSSTYCDLKHIRNGLKSFIESFGYEAVLFEDGAIPYDHLLALDQSCYSEVRRCHMLILIIDGRYGSLSSTTESVGGNENYDSYTSITVNEYRSARDSGIPIFVFIERNVCAEYRTFKVNKDNPEVKWAHVDDAKVFKFIEQIYSQKIGNPVFEFDKFEDISNYLRDQWAGLFAEYLRQQQDKKILSNISDKIDELSQVSVALRAYTESLMKQAKPEDYDKIINNESKKIEDAKRRSFKKSGLSNMIIELASEHHVNLPDIDIYSEFTRSKDFEDLLSRLGFSNSDIELITMICYYGDKYLDLKFSPDINA